MKTEFDGKEYFGHPDFYALLQSMAELHSHKNHDYSGSGDPLKNLRAPSRIGVPPFTGVLVRLQDKWARLEQYMLSGQFLVKGEGVEDTLMDNAVYSLLAIILYREQQALLSKESALTNPKTCGGCLDQQQGRSECLMDTLADSCFQRRTLPGETPNENLPRS